MRFVRIERPANFEIPAAGSSPVAPPSISRALPRLPSTQFFKSFLGLETFNYCKSEATGEEIRSGATATAPARASKNGELQLVRIERHANLAFPAAGSTTIAPASVSSALPHVPRTELSAPLFTLESSKERQSTPHRREPARRTSRNVNTDRVCWLSDCSNEPAPFRLADFLAASPLLKSASHAS